MQLFESSEDYLERILVLELKNGSVRSIDIVESMNFSKASVSVAMKKLKENDYIVVEANGHIHLTEKGKEVANKIYERHLYLTKGLVMLGVSENQAKIDACKIEHDLSEETFSKIKELIDSKSN